MKSTIYSLVLVLFFFLSCTNKNAKETTQQELPAQTVEIVYHVEGMTCDHCEMSIQKGVNELNGIEAVEANHEDSTTRVIYDPSKTDEKEIMAAIEKRGYTVAPQ